MILQPLAGYWRVLSKTAHAFAAVYHDRAVIAINQERG